MKNFSPFQIHKVFPLKNRLSQLNCYVMIAGSKRSLCFMTSFGMIPKKMLPTNAPRRSGTLCIIKLWIVLRVIDSGWVDGEVEVPTDAKVKGFKFPKAEFPRANPLRAQQQLKSANV
jgi:hypothetical protein